MRNLRLLDVYRDSGPRVMQLYGWAGDETCGVFRIPSPIDKSPMLVIASSEGGWEHVSVSRQNRCPNWPEMAFAKNMFFKDDEIAVEYHVPSTDHINQAEYCLHLWRPTGQEMPRPPSIMVGHKPSEAL